jgi:hypothetical protein
VQNVGGGIAAFVKVQATIVGPAGASTPVTYTNGPVLRRVTSVGFTTASTLAAGETGCFRIATGIPRAQLTVLDLDLSYQLTALAAPASRVELAGPVTTRESTGRLRWAGELQNTGSLVTQFNDFVLNARNASGQLIDCGSAFVRGSRVTTSSGTTTDTGLLPGQRAPFDGISVVSSSAVASMTFFVIWQSDEPPAASRQLSEWPAAATALMRQRTILQSRLSDLMDRRDGTPSAKEDEIAFLRNELERLAALVDAILGSGS